MPILRLAKESANRHRAFAENFTCRRVQVDDSIASEFSGNRLGEINAQR